MQTVPRSYGGRPSFKMGQNFLPFDVPMQLLSYEMFYLKNNKDFSFDIFL